MVEHNFFFAVSKVAALPSQFLGSLHFSTGQLVRNTLCWSNSCMTRTAFWVIPITFMIEICGNEIYAEGANWPFKSDFLFWWTVSGVQLPQKSRKTFQLNTNSFSEAHIQLAVSKLARSTKFNSGRWGRCSDGHPTFSSQKRWGRNSKRKLLSLHWKMNSQSGGWCWARTAGKPYP